MSDFDKVLEVWRTTQANGEDYVLASIVRVEGSSYRKPGARMILTRGGRRAGSISGGCLEAEVSRQAWWLTENGPAVKAYTTSFEMDAATEEARPYGLGCGGIVHLLLERRETAEAFLQELDVAFAGRKPLECAVVLEGAAIGTRTFARGNERLADRPSPGASERGNGPALWVEKIAPRCGLFVFGAGDDAEPLVTQASTLGWHIAVADGRAHLATRHRFPLAHEVTVLRDSDVSAMELRESDAAVVMTHSYEQDSRILAQLLPMPLLYLGVLGPRYRTLEMVKQAVKTTGGDAAEWMRKLHAPVGMDLGGDSPATIALSIAAEIQSTLAGRAGREKRQSKGGPESRMAAGRISEAGLRHDHLISGIGDTVLS